MASRENEQNEDQALPNSGALGVTDLSNVEIVSPLENKGQEEEPMLILDSDTWEKLVNDILDSGTCYAATKQRLENLRIAAEMGCPDEEIAHYAELSRATLYNWYKKYPLLQEFIYSFKEAPVFKARKTIVEGLGSVDTAFSFIRAKRKREFGNTLDLTTDNKPITGFVVEIVNEYQGKAEGN